MSSCCYKLVVLIKYYHSRSNGLWQIYALLLDNKQQYKGLFSGLNDWHNLIKDKGVRARKLLNTRQTNALKI